MFVHTVIMVIEPHMKQGRQHKLISTIFLATSVTKKLDHNKKLFRVLAEHDINENSFLGHTITQLVIDELEAFYNILSEESGI